MTFIKATGAVGMVIGGGAEQYTRRLRREMGESVVFLGPKRGTELGKYMQAADFGVHFCEDDTWGQVVTEWMASAKPVLVPDKGAPQAVIRNQETGFVCQNPDDYARYTTVLTDNPDKLAEMSRLSRDLALTYTWKAAGAALVKNCYDAIDGSTVTSPNLALGRAA